MNFRREPIRSKKLLDSAKGQPCTLEFVGICNHDPETTVSCHIHDETFGLAMKADDTATVHGCSSCHVFMDQGGWIGRVSQTVMLRHILRAIFRTMRNRIERGLMVIPLDPERLSSERQVKPRKPPTERKKVPAGRPLESRSNWPPKGSRTIPTRNLTKAQP